MSVGIKLENGEFVKLTNASIKFVLKSNLFSDKIHENSRSFPFKGPTEGNDKHFGHVSHLQVANKELNYKAQVFVFGIFWKNAILQIIDFTDSEYTFRLLIDRGYNSLLSTKSLRDFKYNDPLPIRFTKLQLPRSFFAIDTTLVTSPTTINFQFFLTYSSTPINKSFNFDPATQTSADLVAEIVAWFNEKTFDFHYIFEQDSLSPDEFVIYNLSSNTNSGFYFNITSPDPNFEIISIGGNNVDHLTALRRLTDDCLQNERDYIIAPVLAPSLYSDNNTNYKRYQNPIIPKVTGNPSFNLQFSDTSQPLTPFPFLKKMLYLLLLESGNTVVEDSFFDEELSRLILYNHESINNFRRISRLGWRYRFTGTFYFSDIVPDIPLNVFLNDLRTLFNLHIGYNSKDNTVRILRVEKLIDEDPEDLSQYALNGWKCSAENKMQYGLLYTWVGEPLSNELLPSIPSFQFGPDVSFKSDLPTSPIDGFIFQRAVKENKIYQFVSGQWILVAEDLYDYKADSPLQMRTGASPLFTTEDEYVRPNTTWPFDVKWILPYTLQTGNMLISDKVEAPHRYLIYRGLVPCSLKIGESSEYVLGSYPLVSSHNYDYFGNKIGDYSLAYNHEDGLYQKLWKRWLTFIKNSEPVTINLNLPFTILADIDINRKKRINGVEFFIEDLEFEVGESISVTKLKAFPIYRTHESA